MKFLIAEDGAVSRLLLQQTLKKFGHEYVVAEDGAQAWELFQRTEVDVVISDWVMPGVDGLELCRRVRSRDADRHTYFIFLSALEDQGHVVEGMQAGADEYLIKPVNPVDLQARLVEAERVLGLHHKLAMQKKELERLSPTPRLVDDARARDELEILLGRARRYGHRYSVAICEAQPDPENPTRIRSDEALDEVADVLMRHCRGGDIIYRLGGARFLLILPEQPTEPALVAVNRLRQKAMDVLQVTLKGGVVTLSPGDLRTVDDLFGEVLYELNRSRDGARSLAAAWGI